MIQSQRSHAVYFAVVWARAIQWNWKIRGSNPISPSTINRRFVCCLSFQFCSQACNKCLCFHDWVYRCSWSLAERNSSFTSELLTSMNRFCFLRSMSFRHRFHQWLPFYLAPFPSNILLIAMVCFHSFRLERLSHFDVVSALSGVYQPFYSYRCSRCYNWRSWNLRSYWGWARCSKKDLIANLSWHRTYDLE